MSSSTPSATPSAKTIPAVRWRKLCSVREEHYQFRSSTNSSQWRGGKLKKSWAGVRRALDVLRVLCRKSVPLTIEIHERAVQIGKRYGYSIFDSLVIAAALHAGPARFTRKPCDMAKRSMD